MHFSKRDSALCRAPAYDYLHHYSSVLSVTLRLRISRRTLRHAPWFSLSIRFTSLLRRYSKSAYFCSFVIINPSFPLLLLCVVPANMQAWVFTFISYLQPAAATASSDFWSSDSFISLTTSISARTNASPSATGPAHKTPFNPIRLHKIMVAGIRKII